MEFTLKKEKPGQLQVSVGGTPSVDLLPAEIVQKRTQRRLFKDWGVRIVGAVAFVALVCAGLLGWQTATALQLNAVRAEGTALVSQIGAKGEIQQLLDLERSLDGFREEAQATNLSWTEALGRIKSKLPSGAWVCAFSLTAGGAPTGEPEQQIGLAGDIEVCGPFESAIPFLRDIESVEGIASVSVTASAWDSSISAFKHSMRVRLDQTIYSGSNVEPAPAPAPPVEAEPETGAAADAAAPTEADAAGETPVATEEGAAQ